MTTYTEVDLDVSLASISMGDATKAQQMRASRYIDQKEKEFAEIAQLSHKYRNEQDALLRTQRQIESLRADADRLDFMVNECAVMNSYNGSFWIYWPLENTQQIDRYSTARESIDAAICAAALSQQVEANHE